MTRRRRSISSPLRGDQHVERRAAGRGLGNVVDLPVSDGDGPGQPRARDIGQRPVDGGEQPRAGIAALRHRDGAQLQVGQPGRLLADRGPRRLGQARTLAHLHRRGLVHHQQADIRQVFAGFLHQARAGQPGQQHRESGQAPQRPACPPHRRQRHHQRSDNHQPDDEPFRQQRLEAQRGDDFLGVHQGWRRCFMRWRSRREAGRVTGWPTGAGQRSPHRGPTRSADAAGVRWRNEQSARQ